MYCQMSRDNEEYTAFELWQDEKQKKKKSR